MPDGKYITLKEAAEISGYAPDYIGQLIRKGKLPGKQVYYNVAWVTTETAVNEYLKKGGNNASGVVASTGMKLSMLKNKIAQRFKADKAFKVILYAVISISILAFLYLFAIISININDRLEERAMERIEKKALIQSVDEKNIFNSL